MAKIFKFDAIGRDLYPEERLAARDFTRKYQSPPTKADTHREMAQIVGRVRRAAAQIDITGTLRASATVTRSATVQSSTKAIAASALSAKAPPKRSSKD